MVMIGHQAIGQQIKRLFNQMSAHQAQKVQIVFPFKKDEIAIVATIVEMVVIIWLERKIATRHEDGLDVTVP